MRRDWDVGGIAGGYAYGTRCGLRGVSRDWGKPECGGGVVVLLVCPRGGVNEWRSRRIVLVLVRRCKNPL